MHRHTVSIALSLAVLVPLGILCRAEVQSGDAATAQWKPFQSEAGRFSVLMPAPPKETQTKQRSIIGTVTNQIFTAWSGQEKFTVDYSDLPHFGVTFAGTNRIYDHTKGALLKQTLSKMSYFDDATLNGLKGKRLVYDTPPRQGYPEVTGEAYFLLLGDRLYVVHSTVPIGDSEANAKRFFASFKVESQD